MYSLTHDQATVWRWLDRFKSTVLDEDSDKENIPLPCLQSIGDKRRSGRHAQRKKYVDDVELNLSDDENLLMNLPPEAAAAAKAAREADKAAEAAEAAAAAASSSEAKDDSGTVTPKETGEDQLKAPPNSEDVSAEVTQSGPNYAYVVST